jgi:hypothetical protein
MNEIIEVDLQPYYWVEDLAHLYFTLETKIELIVQPGSFKDNKFEGYRVLLTIYYRDYFCILPLEINESDKTIYSLKYSIEAEGKMREWLINKHTEIDIRNYVKNNK